MKKILCSLSFILLLVAYIILLGAFNKVHRQSERVIEERNYQFELIHRLICFHEYGKAIELLEEWGVEYCCCVAWSENALKITGPGIYKWVHGCWKKLSPEETETLFKEKQEWEELIKDYQGGK